MHIKKLTNSNALKRGELLIVLKCLGRYGELAAYAAGIKLFSIYSVLTQPYIQPPEYTAINALLSRSEEKGTDRHRVTVPGR